MAIKPSRSGGTGLNLSFQPSSGGGCGATTDYMHGVPLNLDQEDV